MELTREKNVATRIVFPLLDANGDFKSGAGSLDSEMTYFADGSNPGSFADCTNEATEICSTGVYYLNLTQAEMNHDYIIVQIKATDVKTQAILITTKLPATLAAGVSVASIGAGVITSSAIATDAITSTGLATSAVTEIVNAIKAIVVESQGSYTLQQVLSAIFAVACGVSADGGLTFKSPNGAETRVAATVNGSRERTAVTVTPSS